jgi:hypothetical protein
VNLSSHDRHLGSGVTRVIGHARVSCSPTALETLTAWPAPCKAVDTYTAFAARFWLPTREIRS